MGRQSISGRLRTVDDDLAENNMTRQDIAYKFKPVWSHFKRQGWYARPGDQLSYDHFYIKPGKNIERDIEGVDFFYGEAALVQYAVAVGLFEGEEQVVSPHTNTPSDQAVTPRSSSNQSTPSSADSMKERRGNNHSNGSAATGAASTTTTTNNNNNNKSAAAPAKLKTSSASIKVKTETKRSTPTIQRRQWPSSHPSKGRHAGDAISLESDEDDEDSAGEAQPRHKGPPSNNGKSSKPRAGSKKRYFRVIEDDDSDNFSSRSADNNSIHPDEDDQDDDDGSIGTASLGTDDIGDGGSDHETASTGSTKGKRPLLRTRARKKAKPTPTTKQPKYKSMVNGVAYAVKRKNAGRGVMVQPNSSFETHGRLTLEESPPPTLRMPRRDPGSPSGARTPASHHTTTTTPKAAHGLASAFESAGINMEPTVVASPLRPPSRASSVASSHTSGSAQRQASSTNTGSITLLDAEGVGFPSCPNEKYRVVVTQATDGAETTIWMEEATTNVQRSIAFPDITRFGDPANHNLHTDEIIQALLHTLAEAGGNVRIGPPAPPEEVKPDPELLAAMGIQTEAVKPPKVSMIDFTKDDETSSKLVLFFPISITLKAVKHRFPMTVVPESRQLKQVKRELERTKHELDLARRDMEAFRKQHEMLEREYQKLRTAAEAEAKKKKPTPASPLHVSTETAPSSATSSPARGAVKHKHSRCFAASSSWLDTAFPRSPASASEHIRQVGWTTIVDPGSEHFTLTTAGTSGPQNITATITTRGSYQLNVGIAHEPSMQLVLSVQSGGGEETVAKLVYPTLVQICQTAENKKRISRIDQVIYLHVDDTVTVYLRPRRAEDAGCSREVWRSAFAPPQNTWTMTFLDKHCIDDASHATSNGTVSH